MAAGLRSEIKQNVPFESLEQETLLALLRTADLLQGRLAEMLKPHAISATQYNALRILRGAGSDGLACTEIARRMINRDPDITRLMNRLERRGLTVRARNRNDRRVITARITPKGLEFLSGLDKPVQEFNRRLLGHLGKRRLKTLVRLLQDARGNTA